MEPCGMNFLVITLEKSLIENCVQIHVSYCYYLGSCSQCIEMSSLSALPEGYILEDDSLFFVFCFFCVCDFSPLGGPLKSGAK